VRKVSHSLAESKNQTESERQSNVSEFNEVNKETNNLAVNIQDGPPTGTQSAARWAPESSKLKCKMTILMHAFQAVYVPFLQKILVLKLVFQNFANTRNSF